MFARSKLIAAAAIATLAVFAVPASAQSTWNYANFTQNTSNKDNFGNSWYATQGSTKLTVYGYSSSGSGSTFATANVANYGSGSGFGVRNQTEGLNVTAPNHSMDNFTSTDMLALNFTNSSNSSAVNMMLTSLTTGWHNTSTSGCSPSSCGTDSDISLLRWTKSTGPTITGGTIGTLLSAGWELVNNYANMVDDTARATGAKDTQSSSWWLISAYNSAWGSGTNTSNLSNGDDFVKVLASVSALPQTPNIGTVPEPASLALVAAALGGIYFTRRRQTRA